MYVFCSQTSNGMNRYQNNITPGAFNLGMGAQQTQRPDMTAPNLRPNIGNPHHVSTKSVFSLDG